MPESRDRLSRPEEVRATFARRRQSIVGGIAILLDEEQEVGSTPFRWGATPMTGTRGLTGAAARGGGGSVGRGVLGTPRSNYPNRIGGHLRRTTVVGRENMGAASFRRGRGRGSVLPSWYPRTPLRDVTAVVRAIERRRASLREREGLQIDSPIPQPQDQHVLVPSEPASSAQLEQDVSLITPNPPVGRKKKPCGELDFLTPQKKLLNSIEIVEKVVMDELRKLKSTPSAKKAERQNKVRTLMSMR